MRTNKLYLRSRWALFFYLTLTTGLALTLTACKQAQQTSSRSTVVVSNAAQDSIQTALMQLKQIVKLQRLDSATDETKAVNDTDSTRQDIQPDDSAILRLCQSEPDTHGCTGPAPTLSAQDLGFIPATLAVESIKLTDIHETNTGWAAAIQIQPIINGISPWCQPGRLRIELDENGRTSTTIDSAWCNWLLYGNIELKLAISAEELNPEQRSFGGFYELHVRGTSNAAASGYLMARFES